MSGELLYRAAGCYAEEIAREFGFLVLQAAVLANMRLKDGNHYSPDPRIIPRSGRELQIRMRRRWRETEAILPIALDFVEQRDELVIPRNCLPHDWSDVVSLSRLAVGLRPHDPLARVTLSFSSFRTGALELARTHIDHAIDKLQPDPDLTSRLLRNKAVIVEYADGFSDAFKVIQKSREESPADKITTMSVLAYAVAGGDYESVRRLIREMRTSWSPHEVNEAMRLIRRERSAPNLRISLDSEMADLVGGSLATPCEGLLLSSV